MVLLVAHFQGNLYTIATLCDQSQMLGPLYLEIVSLNGLYSLHQTSEDISGLGQSELLPRADARPTI